MQVFERNSFWNVCFSWIWTLICRLLGVFDPPNLADTVMLLCCSKLVIG